MKKLRFFLFILTTVALTGCDKKDTFTLKGSIEGLPSDTLLVYYQNPDYKLDTIIAEKGRFTYTISPDTFTIFSLVTSKGQNIPVFADKGEHVTLSGHISQIEIKGKGENEKLAQICHYLGGMENNRNSIKAAVDSLIKADPHSYTNLYLIDTYYVRDTLPDYEKIGQLIKGLSGVIKDTPYIIDLQNKLDDIPDPASRRSVSSISCTDANGKTVSWNQLKNNYVLLDFWASWNRESVIAQDSLVPVQKALKKEKFTIVSLSLDLDRKEWLAACQRDTTRWKQVCDFKGWENTIVKQQGINRLPSNLLIGPDKRVIAENIRGKELIDKVKELIRQDKEKEKEAKKARKK